MPMSEQVLELNIDMDKMKYFHKFDNIIIYIYIYRGNGEQQ